jgi:transposase
VSLRESCIRENRTCSLSGGRRPARKRASSDPTFPARCRRPGAALDVRNGINTRMRHTRDLTDEQWQTLDPLIPKPRKRRDDRGRPWKSRRSVLNGVLRVLRTDAPWADLPDRYPSFQTCHRRFQQWVRFGVMRQIMVALAHELSIRGAIDVS